MKTHSPTNILPMPTRPPSPHRANAREMIEQYYKRKQQASASRPDLTQSDIDGRPKGWERESETTNGKMAKLLGGE